MTLLQILQPEEASQSAMSPPAFSKVLEARKDRSYTPLKVVRGLLGPTPLTILNYSAAQVGDLLKATLHAQKFDSVQLASSHLASYIGLIRSAPGSPRILLDWHNIESELLLRFASETKSLPKRLVARRTAKLLRNLELDLLAGCDLHTVVSERERTELLRLQPAAKVCVVPNGVDTSAFVPMETTSSQKTLLFVGSMDYHANIDAVQWFANAVWPIVAERFPSFSFTVAGRSPGREVQMLASDRIRITGTVADVRPFYSDALAVVVPLRVGGGTRLKILEAMAMGVPVISTALGAEGISCTDGRNILLANSEQDMVRAVQRVAENPALRRQLSAEGRSLVSRHYDWTGISDHLFELHSGLTTSRAGW